MFGPADQRPVVAAPAPLSADGERVLHCDDDLLIRWVPGRSDRIVLACTGVQHRMGGMPMNELGASAAGTEQNHIVYVSDMRRTWLSAAGITDRIAAVVSGLMAETGASRLDAIGNSMGGYCAARLAEVLPIGGVAGFVPQVSMHPEVIAESRWLEYRPDFGPELLPSLNPAIAASEGTRFHMFFGWDDAADRAQAAVLDDHPRLTIWKIAGSGHQLARLFKEACVLFDITQAALSNDTERLDLLLAPFLARPEVIRPDHGGA